MHSYIPPHPFRLPLRFPLSTSTLSVQYNAQNSAAAKLVTNASQRRRHYGRKGRVKGMNRIRSFANNSERQSFVCCTVPYTQSSATTDRAFTEAVSKNIQNRAIPYGQHKYTAKYNHTCDANSPFPALPALTQRSSYLHSRNKCNKRNRIKHGRNPFTFGRYRKSFDLHFGPRSAELQLRSGTSVIHFIRRLTK
ncbi:hypothetical protein EVAR_100024_1 [Eumeta japonica]|uniref:Uncharacterized protein n=1 Tax=Eumeta variegata TaxID=151549 RepID=A0A4C1ZNV5_EUMVA|nr:hypothetical protein EVAR_100024_1 [Eumeta japonica]